MLEVFSDFLVPLMKILDGLPNRGGYTENIILLFEQNYRDQIVPHQFTKNQSGKIRWEHNVRWSREKLKLLGLIDAPQRGIWRLTEKGHQWLVEHPNFTHLSIEKPKSKPKNNMVQSSLTQKTKMVEPISQGEFLTALQENLSSSLQSVIGSVFHEFVQRSNYFQIRLAGFSGCHYEIILRQGKHEIALHFESSAERSQARLQGFEPHLEALNQSLKMPVLSGNFGNRGWTQVHIEKPVQPLSHELVKTYVDLVEQFMAVTFPILQKIYANEGSIRRLSSDKGNFADASPLHQVLDQEIETIQAYLQGRSSQQINDEKLCDWVNFCYTLKLYSEGKDLFSLVSGLDVNPWYYERTKKISKACEQKIKLAEIKAG